MKKLHAHKSGAEFKQITIGWTYIISKRGLSNMEVTMSKKTGKTTERGRDAGTGQFIPVDKARRNRETAVVERVPLPSKKKR